MSDLNATDRRWLLARQRLIDFITKHGRYPLRRSGSDEERYLGEWIHSQRRLRRSGAPFPLTASRITKLEQVPGWQWDPVRRRNPRANRSLSTPDVVWNAHYQQLADYLELTGGLPRLDSDEGRLRRWLYGQERRLSRRPHDPLAVDRLARLRLLTADAAEPRQRSSVTDDAAG